MSKLTKGLLLLLALLALVFAGKTLIHKGHESRTLPGYASRNIYVYNLTQAKEVLAYNENERVAPASLVKIMTVHLALKKIQNLNALAPVDTETYSQLVEKNASLAGFQPGEQTTYRDLLYGTMLPSGGECADSLAINLAGSLEAFTEEMNQEAQALKLKRTHFKNPSGLDAFGQTSTARDIALLLATSLKDGNFRAIFTSPMYQSTPTAAHPHGLVMTSTVMRELRPDMQPGFQILGGKSGTTDKAGLCWATLAQKNGEEYIVVVMGAPLEDITAPGDEQIQDTLKILQEL